MSITFSKSHSPEDIKLGDIREVDGWENFIDGATDNPFARICCRTRRLTPTMCDGACIECRKARESYEAVMPTTIVTTAEVANAGDPDGVVPDIADARAILAHRLMRIQQAKEEIFHKRDRALIEMIAPSSATLH
jgi:hypothetical protein